MSRFAKVSSAEMMAIVRAMGFKEQESQLKSNDSLAHHFAPAPFKYLINFRWARKVMQKISDKKIPGGLPYIVAKSRAIDDMLEQALQESGIQQLIFLGAGFDTRAHRFQALLTDYQVYEIDHPCILERKKALMDKQRFPQTKVNYCAADFDDDKVKFEPEWLMQFGIQPNLKTLFIIDGVSYFISAQAFDHVLKVIASFESGSEVIFDYAYQEILEDKLYYGSHAFKEELNKVGEPVINGISDNQIRYYLNGFNLDIVHLLKPADIKQDYLTAPDGQSHCPYGFLDIVRAKVR